ncbi:aromatic amino acid lyase [Thioalkalivibrio sp. ALJ24]|uniref:aromatic amino acid lyase n=1 Tax=Thioalkalivibrio sp. ALJ24 TaxID=545276 RepID=UPI0012EA7C71
MSRITDHVRNDGLPAFLQPNTTGLDSGVMGAQVTATALITVIRTVPGEGDRVRREPLQRWQVRKRRQGSRPRAKN